MLTDPRALAIISRARQRNVAKPDRTGGDFERIFLDFFPDPPGAGFFAGKLLLDLGPGQYDFARMVRARGGRCENIDNDPAVNDLGEYLGFTVHPGNLKRVDLRPFAGRYDGLFCKLSINAFWWPDPQESRDRVRALDGVLHAGGWGWIAPWNGRPAGNADAGLARPVLQSQAEAFGACGWTVLDLSERQARSYGLTGRVENHALFLKNLHVPEWLRP